MPFAITIMFNDDAPYFVTEAGLARWGLPISPLDAAHTTIDWTLHEERSKCGSLVRSSVSLVVTTPIGDWTPALGVAEQMTLDAALPIAFECRRTSDGAIVKGTAHLSLESYLDPRDFSMLRIRGETVGEFTIASNLVTTDHLATSAFALRRQCPSRASQVYAAAPISEWAERDRELYLRHCDEDEARRHG